MKSRIGKLIGARLFISLIFELIVIFYQLKYTPYTFSTNLLLLYGLFLGIIFMSILYLFLHRRGIDEVKNFYLQFSMDPIFITFFVFLTGGSESPLSFLYILLIVAAGAFLYRRGALFTAGVSFLFYGTLLDLQYFDYISPVFLWAEEEVLFTKSELFYKLVLHLFAFFIAAMLSGYMSERLRGGMKRIDPREIERIARAIPASLPSGVIVLDRNGRITYMNRMAERLLDVSFREIYKETLTSIFPFDLSAGERKEKDFLLKGKKKIFGYSVLDFLGEEPFVLIIFQDLTEIKRKEEEMMRNEKFISLGRMASVIAHEIRNPLGSISGAAQIIMSRTEDEKIKKMGDIVMRECERLENLLSEFIEFSTMEIRRREKVDIVKEIDEVLSMMTGHLPNLKVVREFPEGAIYVDGDRNLLREAFINIIKNSIEAMPDGGELRAELSRDGEEVVIAITDTGHGIPDEIKDKIFEPFFTTKHRGSGLGLSITYKIVALHSGKIYVNSPPSPRGTSLVIRLPLSPSGNKA